MKNIVLSSHKPKQQQQQSKFRLNWIEILTSLYNIHHHHHPQKKKIHLTRTERKKKIFFSFFFVIFVVVVAQLLLLKEKTFFWWCCRRRVCVSFSSLFVFVYLFTSKFLINFFFNLLDLFLFVDIGLN